MGNIKSAPRQLRQASSAVGNGRYEVCRLLADKRVPNVIWLEDLLALHGSDTQVWDLHLLVEDPLTAAKSFSIVATKKHLQRPGSKTIPNLVNGPFGLLVIDLRRA